LKCAALLSLQARGALNVLQVEGCRSCQGKQDFVDVGELFEQGLRRVSLRSFACFFFELGSQCQGVPGVVQDLDRRLAPARANQVGDPIPHKLAVRGLALHSSTLSRHTVIVEFRRGIVTPASTWRALILYGANAATYKFAFGRALLETAAEGHEQVSLRDLAPRYAALLGEALEREPRQGTARSSRFLDALRAHAEGKLPLEDMHAVTVRSGFSNVVDAFPMLGGSTAPVTFYEDRRKDPGVRGLVLAPDLRDLAQRGEQEWLDRETDARWRLVAQAVSATDANADEGNGASAPLLGRRAARGRAHSLHWRAQRTSAWAAHTSDSRSARRRHNQNGKAASSARHEIMR
jgi:hypothetical protein